MECDIENNRKVILKDDKETSEVIVDVVAIEQVKIEYVSEERRKKDIYESAGNDCVKFEPNAEDDDEKAPLIVINKVNLVSPKAETSENDFIVSANAVAEETIKLLGCSDNLESNETDMNTDDFAENKAVDDITNYEIDQGEEGDDEEDIMNNGEESVNSNSTRKKKIVDWKAKQASQESHQSMDQAVRRITEKWHLEKLKIRRERERRDRLNNIYTILAVLLIVAFAVLIVSVKIALYPKPDLNSPPPEKPKVQWMMDWYVDQPGAHSNPRTVPVKWESIYNLDYWLYHRNNQN